ncbi:MAG: glutathione S-transferase family protein [Pseudomonadota bacterium]|nr:glutathione S-transferase family protein [Pseudomonadota bacterium]
MSLQLFAHPFASYCWKVLIALYANGTEFEYRMLDAEHPENFAELKRHWPFGTFPMLVDDGEPLIESTPIIEYLHAHYRGENDWIPVGEMEQRVRFLDRFFDLYVMTPMQKIVGDALRPDGVKDPFGVDEARRELNTAYDWIEGQLGGPWAVGEEFTLADCAAAPSLFYADWVEPIGDTRPQLSEYRARLLGHPAVSRCVEEARPYRPFFPLGAPDRD